MNEWTRVTAGPNELSCSMKRIWRKLYNQNLQRSSIDRSPSKSMPRLQQKTLDSSQRILDVTESSSTFDRSCRVPSQMYCVFVRFNRIRFEDLQLCTFATMACVEDTQGTASEWWHAGYSCTSTAYYWAYALRTVMSRVTSGVYKMYRSGPSTKPYGTPYRTGIQAVNSPQMVTIIVCPPRKKQSQSRCCPTTP